MKKIVISLKRRQDRKVEFKKNNLKDFKYLKAIDYKTLNNKNFKVDENFRDPFLNRQTLKSEVACFLSHKKAWEECQRLYEPVIILEDDAVINDTWDEEYYEKLLEDYEFIYLQRNENEPDKVKSIDSRIEKPSYPYNLTGYVIEPTTATKLLHNYKEIIPVDEYIPRLIKKGLVNAVALKHDACNQLPRSISESDIENNKTARNFTVHPITVGSDRLKCVKLNTSARKHGIEVKNLGTNVEWKGTDMSGPGGGMKANLLRDYVNTLPDNDVVLFTDAYDVFYADNLETITERYLDFNTKAVFSAELYCYPDNSIANEFPESNTPYRYLNSGTFIAQVGELKKMFASSTVADDGDDQLYYQKLLLSNEFDMTLDYEGYIFQTHEEATGINSSGQLYNPRTNCCACIYHGNGGDNTKDKFNALYNVFHPRTDYYFSPSKSYEIIEDDMLVADFMTQEQCERLIKLADKNGNWDSLKYDKFPAQEIRIKELGLWTELEAKWNEFIVPILEKYWKPTEMYGLRDAFVMRYNLDTQRDLPLHTDASLVTGSVKLNDDYEGADLFYPRQNISNKDIPVGKILLFPGMVTHGHECLPLTKGTKYSFTIWSNRFPGDNI